MNTKTLTLFTIIMFLFSYWIDADELRLKRHFGDNMVIQRNKSVTIRGKATKSATVILRYAGQEKKGKADETGEWAISLDPLKASVKGESLHVQCGNKRVTLRNVVVGDVFLFARQTTVDISMGRDEKGRKSAGAYKKSPLFRAMTIRTIPARKQQEYLDPKATAGWTVVDSKSALRMSQTAFFVGRDLAESSGVPIGIIDLNMGKGFPIGWMERSTLLMTHEVYPDMKMHGKHTVESVAGELERKAADHENGKAQQLIDDKYSQLVKKAREKNSFVPDKPALPPHPINDPRYPAAGYNAVLHAIRGLPLKAILLQLGNDYPYSPYQELVNRGKDLDRALLGQAWDDCYIQKKQASYLAPVTIPRIPREWRRIFRERNLPVAFIMPPSSPLGTLAIHHMEMRELQRRTAEAEPGVGLVLPGNESVPFSAQPADEELLAERCLAWVRGAVYLKKDVAPSGPRLRKMTANYSKAQLFFEPGTANGLKASGDAIKQFEVAGRDGKYFPATATVDGETIRLSSNQVPRIVFARFNWRQTPDHGLVNNAGLPAIPFRNDGHAHPEVIIFPSEELPEEYFLHANKWKQSSVEIINGAMARAAESFSQDGNGYLGATGIRVVPFGPNMSVYTIHPGSPADGKVMPGDLIYGVNGELMGDNPLREVSKSITEAETEEGAGKIVFNLRRKGVLLAVELTLEVLGAYSVTAPYDCPKTDRIIANMEGYLAKRGGILSGEKAFTNYDALFLLAAGTPENQGLVRRLVYGRMASVNIDKALTKEGPHERNWSLSIDAVLAAEYYLATGDRNVLSYLKWMCDYLALTQVQLPADGKAYGPKFIGQEGSWYHNPIWHGRPGYNPLPCIAVTALHGFELAQKAGVEIDSAAHARALAYFEHKGIRYGRTSYGTGVTPITEPLPIDPDKLEAGKLSSHNGAISLAAVIYKLRNDPVTAHTCSFLSAYAFDNTHTGHGGNFWNNTWTSLGARVHSKKAFVNFMQKNCWYRELNRMHNHVCVTGGQIKGAAQMMGLTVPRERLFMTGARSSVFAEGQEEFYQPGLTAYFNRDYAGCLELITEVINTRQLSAAELTKARQLARAAYEIQESIKLDLQKVGKLINEGKFYEASLDLPQLRGVVPEDNKSLVAIEETLSLQRDRPEFKLDKARYDKLQNSLDYRFNFKSTATPIQENTWTPLMRALSPAEMDAVAKGKPVPDDVPLWRIEILENISQAPADWAEPTFNDTEWRNTPLPMSWHINHSALLRTTFNISDKADVDALRFRMIQAYLQNVRVYINGVEIARINKTGRRNPISVVLGDRAIAALKNGDNTLAVSCRHNWRWGAYYKGVQTAARNSVSNSGVTIALDIHRR